jgi:hypothetical protein
MELRAIECHHKRRLHVDIAHLATVKSWSRSAERHLLPSSAYKLISNAAKRVFDLPIVFRADLAKIQDAGE